MTAMKKTILSGIACTLALFTFTSCNQDLLNIPQKGVIAYEDFYKTDDDALSALTTVYNSFITMVASGNNGINNPSYNVFVNAPGDELYWGGGKKNGSSSGGQDMNEFRNTYDNTIPHIRYIYKETYKVIYKCNLLLDNFYGENGELCDSPVKKRCVAEARVIRAWSHFFLACYFGTPPLVEHVLSGDARPTNCDHQTLMDWCIAEFQAAIPDLEPRKGPNDKPGAYKITTGAAQAFLGKAQVFNKDWEGAKASLKAVINSGNYALVPTDRIKDLFHVAGDGCEEKVFETNYVYNSSVRNYHSQRNDALFFRMLKAYPDVLIKTEGWGNNCAPTVKFADAMMAHEPDSPRRKAWFSTYLEVLTEFDYSMTLKNDPQMTTEEKLMDPNRGLDFNKYDELYANYGYFFMKFMPWQCDVVPNSANRTEENRIVMRYAEVLLLYAEACAMTNDPDGLKYLNMIAERAGAPTYDALTMENVKQEKWFELAWEGTRFLDLVRWGDAANELAFKSRELTPYLFDPFYVYKSKGKQQSGLPHSVEVHWIDDGWAASGGGYVPGKHELYPFPFDVVELNPYNPETGEGLKQNPGWE